MSELSFEQMFEESSFKRLRTGLAVHSDFSQQIFLVPVRLSVSRKTKSFSASLEANPKASSQEANSPMSRA